MNLAERHFAQRGWFRKLTSGMAIASLCWAVVVVVLVRLLGDRWWLGTLALYSPRWQLMLPFFVALFVWPWLQRRLKLAMVPAALLLYWGASGFCLPYAGWFVRSETNVRVLTCNVCHWAGGSERLEQLIRDSLADVVLLQEYSDREQLDFPEGWSVHIRGELVIASRYPLKNFRRVARDLPRRWPRPVALQADAVLPQQTLHLMTLHLLSPRYGLANIVDSKTVIAPSRRRKLIEDTHNRDLESRRVSGEIDVKQESMIIGGDFNMPMESGIYQRDWGEYRNAFSRTGFGWGNTRFLEQGGFWFSARIDHILSQGRWHAVSCWVGPDVGSDHRPLIADFCWR